MRLQIDPITIQVQRTSDFFIIGESNPRSSGSQILTTRLWNAYKKKHVDVVLFREIGSVAKLS